MTLACVPRACTVQSTAASHVRHHGELCCKLPCDAGTGKNQGPADDPAVPRPFRDGICCAVPLPLNCSKGANHILTGQFSLQAVTPRCRIPDLEPGACQKHNALLRVSTGP